MFGRIHCSGWIHYSSGRFIGEFGRFIGKIGRYSSVRDFTVHILTQMDFGRFLLNSADFFQKPDGSEGANFLVSVSF
jgi:hypothetical protein